LAGAWDSLSSEMEPVRKRPRRAEVRDRDAEAA